MLYTKRQHLLSSCSQSSQVRAPLYLKDFSPGTNFIILIFRFSRPFPNSSRGDCPRLPSLHGRPPPTSLRSCGTAKTLPHCDRVRRRRHPCPLWSRCRRAASMNDENSVCQQLPAPLPGPLPGPLPEPGGAAFITAALVGEHPRLNRRLAKEKRPVV